MAGMPMMPLSLSAGGGGPSGASANNGISSQLSNPFTFDNSGWIINQHSDAAALTASGSKDANATQQSQPAPAAAAVAGLLGGINPLYLAGAVALYLYMKRR